MPILKLKKHDHIYERISGDGRLTGYQVKIRRTGHAHYSKTFDDLDAAKRAVRQVLTDQDRGHHVDRRAAERTTLGDVIDAAVERLVSGKRNIKGGDSELLRLRKFRRDERTLCQTAMIHITLTQLEDWLEQRLEEVAPSTAKRELGLLKPIFRTAARDLSLPVSVMDSLKSPTVMDERMARLSPDDEVKLFAELAKATNPYVWAAAVFALETACRRGELLRLDWRDYDGRGSIRLDDAKNGRGRDIVLSLRAQDVIFALPGKREGKIFKVTANLLSCAYTYARERAELKSWRWHDFRHEAVSRCFDDGWTAEQVMDVSGHVDIKSLLRYRHAKVDDTIQRLRKKEEREQRRPLILPPAHRLDGKVVDERVQIG